MKTELFLEVQNLGATDALDSAWSTVANENLLYIKHLDGKREIMGSIIPSSALVTDSPIIDVSKLDDVNELRTDFFSFQLSAYAVGASEIVDCLYDRDNKKIVTTGATLTQDQEYFFRGHFYTTNVIDITKMLRDK